MKKESRKEVLSFSGGQEGSDKYQSFAIRIHLFQEVTIQLDAIFLK
jgi:hypothetical protein